MGTTRAQYRHRVLVIRAVDDQGTRALETAAEEILVVEATLHHGQAAIPQAPPEQLHPQHVGERKGEDSQRQDSEQSQSRFEERAHRRRSIRLSSAGRQ